VMRLLLEAYYHAGHRLANRRAPARLLPGPK
jgi:hypothetical protein